MVKVAYLDCPTGIAGDMLLGAVLDAGVPLDYLRSELAKLGLGDEFILRQERVTRQGQAGTKAHVELKNHKKANPDHQHKQQHHDHQHDHDHPAKSESPNQQPAPIHSHRYPEHSHGRHWPDIVQLIQNAHLNPQAVAWSLAIFENLAIAEGAVHGIPPERVHFHEVGAVDAIVDIVGCSLGLAWLGVEQVYCSALPTGGGTVKAAHGILPVPVPAVLQLFQGHQVQLYDNGIAKELVTPTGAAIAVTLARTFGPPPPLKLTKIGLGAGTLDLPIPNLLRLWLGELAADSTNTAPPYDTDQILELQTQVDDLSPQALGYTLDALYQAGAVEVFTQAIGMKKNRPGVLITVLCPIERGLACEAVLFRETTTLGIRRQIQERHILQRQMISVTIPQGQVQVKIGFWDQQAITVQPEYEDCVKLAQAHSIPWRQIHHLALTAGLEWVQANPKPTP